MVCNQFPAEVSTIKDDLLELNPSDYIGLLKRMDVHFTCTGFYLEVGKVENAKGWILDLSCIFPQIDDLIHEIIPILIERAISFRIPASKEIGGSILSGALGIQEVGKIISIYLENEQIA